MKKRLVRIFLVCCGLVCLLGTTALASDRVAYAVPGGEIYFNASYGSITGYSGDITEVVIPKRINDVKVTQISGYAFANCSTLTSVTIPDTVTFIGESAFMRCENLSDVELGAGLTSIMEYAFNGCVNLTSISLPDGLTELSGSAFSYCGLGSVVIPDSVEELRGAMFIDCYALTSITVHSTNPRYSSVDGVLFNKEQTELIAYPCGKVGEPYTIPENVTTIADAAFYSCVGAKSVIIPDTVTSLGESAFYSCDNLSSVTIGDGVTSIGNYTFAACSKLKRVELGNSITAIREGAFGYCSDLTDIVIPYGVRYIDEEAFAFCTALTDIVIPVSVTDIADWGFHDCENLTNVYYGGTEKLWNTIDIGSYNEALISAIIHYLGAPEIVYPVSGGNIYFDPNTGTIIDCDLEVTEAVIPSEIEGVAVTAIGDEAFYCCDSLTSVTFPDSITVIGMCAFEDCISLTSVTIPGSVTSIREQAFAECWSLTNVTIENGVTTIIDSAFECCESLISVIIPESVREICAYAFDCCDNLEDVYYTGTEDQWDVIEIDSYNEPLTSATIHYNYIPEDGDESESPAVISNAVIENDTISVEIDCQVGFTGWAYCVTYADGGQMASIEIKPISGGGNALEFAFDPQAGSANILVLDGDCVPQCENKTLSPKE